MIGGVVRAANQNTVLVLRERQDALAEMDAVPGDAVEEQVAEVGPGYDVLAIANATLMNKYLG